MTVAFSEPIRIAAVGDLILGDTATTVGFGFSSRYGDPELVPLRRLRTLLDGHIVFGNLETVLSTRSVGRTRRQRDQMRGLPMLAAGLAEAGFTMLSVSNNHADQHGPQAFRDTISALSDVGIRVCGLPGDGPWLSRPETLTFGGRSVGFLAYNLRPPQYGDHVLYARGSADEIVGDVERLSRQSDHVVVSLHWGLEFVSNPSESEELLARRLVAAGADIVLGHHPHVLRRVEAVDGGVVAYSLGNFVSNQLWLPAMRRSMVLTCRLGTRTEVESIVPCAIGADFLPARYDGESEFSGVATGSAFSFSEREYREEFRRQLGRQRRRLYLYTLRNLHRVPVPVLAEMVRETIRNKFSAPETDNRADARPRL